VHGSQIDLFDVPPLHGTFLHSEQGCPYDRPIVQDVSHLPVTLRGPVLVEEARRWKGAPSREESTATRRMAAWDGLEVRQAGRGIMVRARAPWFSWWHERETWEGDPARHAPW